MDVMAHIKECQDALRLAICHVFTQVAKCGYVDSGIFENVLSHVGGTHDKNNGFWFG
jgi:hypothetical protein